MSDLIYRQEAIDAVCKACYIEEDYHKCDGYPETSTWCEELVALRALPSAQPEIIRCKDCKHWDGVDTCDVIDAPVWDKDFCSMAERRSDED